MKTSKEAFDTLLAGQQKMMEWWTDASRQMMGAMSQKDEKKNSDFLNDWYEQQKSLFEEASRITDPKEAFEKAPEQFKKWVDLQVAFSEKWMKAYREGAEKLGVKMPDMNGYSPENMANKAWQAWADNVSQGNDWVQQNILDKLPAAMQPHYRNFNQIYEDMYKSWDPFQRMMKFGLYDKSAVNSFFSPEQYQEMINKMFGFKMSGDPQKWVGQANEMFEKYMDFLTASMSSTRNWDAGWKEFLGKMGMENANPMFQATLDMNQQVKENIEPFLNMLGYGKEAEMVRMMKDIQFAYTAFLLRSAELQNMIYQSGQSSMPDTIKSFYDSYRETEELPNFETFFQRYVDTLEKEVGEVLESREYSVLQAEVSKLGVTVKGKMDELVELSFDQTPFLMKSHGDDLAKEIYALRHKVRGLEKKVKEMEAPAPKPAPKSNTRKKATAK